MESAMAFSKDDQLDLEYLKILRLMKPYITCIMNNDYVQLIRLWLEKISSEEFTNKDERNKYLKQLGKQIEDGVLDVPFVEEPPRGDLPLYDKFLESHPNGKIVDAKEMKTPSLYAVNKDGDIVLKQIAERERCDTIEDKMERVAKYSLQRCDNSKVKKKRMRSSMNAQDKIDRNSPRNDYNRRMIERYDDTKNNNPSRIDYECLSSEDSWLDLTDCSTTNVTEWGSGDKECFDSRFVKTNINRLKDFYELKISNLLSIIEEMKDENLLLKETVAENEKQLQKSIDSRSVRTESSIHNLSNEINILKGRLQELVDMKVALQSSHYAVATEWQKHMSQLEKKMYMLQKENTELQMTVAVMDKKLNLSIEDKDKKTSSIKKKMSDLHEKETALLRELNRKTEAHLKKQILAQNIEKEREFQEQLNQFGADYEKKLVETELRFKEELANKQKENDKLQETILDLENRIKYREEELTNDVTIENSAEKINYLQKCIVKMDKLYHKAEKEYVKQINKLKKELESKDRTLNVQLSTQKAELTAQSSRFRQIEIDNVVNKLEEHYKLLLRQQQADALDAKDEYEKKVQLLKDELDIYKYNKS